MNASFVDRGAGPAAVFQHGLGGDETQVAEVFPDADGLWRRLTLDCRGQGGSPPDPWNRYAIQTFAEDVLRLADERQVERFVAGGISMGAAIALHLAVHYPGRVTALILARPAWLFDAARREAFLGSTEAYLVSIAVALVCAYFLARVFALWMIGPIE